LTSTRKRLESVDTFTRAFAVYETITTQYLMENFDCRRCCWTCLGKPPSRHFLVNIYQ